MLRSKYVVDVAPLSRVHARNRHGDTYNTYTV